MMSTSSNISQSTYSPSEPETPQGTTQTRIQNFDQSLNHADLGLSIEQSMKNAQKEMHQKRIQALRKELDYLKSTEWEFKYEKDSSDDEKDQFLAEELLDLEINAQKYENEITPTMSPIPRTAACYERTGIITHIKDNHVLIDGMLCYEISGCNINLRISDKVLYLCYKDKNDAIVVVRILENQGVFWGDADETMDENRFDIIEHVFVGEVESRQDRTVFVKSGNSSLKYDLDSVTATFVPIQGDWLELLCKVKFDDEKPMDITFDMIIAVISFKAVRSKIMSMSITNWDGETGICDKQIFFDKHCIISGDQPTIGSKALVEAIESYQGIYTWRAIKMHITESMITSITDPIVADEIETKSLEVENKQNIEVTFPLKFENVNFQENPSITLNITNNSDQLIVVNRWIMLCKKKDSQVEISPFLTRPKKIFPRHTFSLTITCNPKFFGRSKEHLIIMFRGFQVERMIEVNVQTIVPETNVSTLYSKTGPNTHMKKLAMLKELRKYKDRPFMPGIRSVKLPHFVVMPLGLFPIPDKIWNAILGDLNETTCHRDFNSIISRIESHLPCLIQTLNINNYTDIWHTLLYMEEIQLTVEMRSYDIPKAFLLKYQEYLSIEINGLAERRPSLIVGDKVYVKDIWDNNIPSYEGYIHVIKGDLVLMKFHPGFHETYSGSDVSIEFHFTRTSYRRAHQAVNLAISNLGVDVLFPSRINTRPYQIPQERVENIEWYNKYLNTGQKSAVKNILMGECRPMPYCIYGPPGTGKTITVIETILQILTQIPDSRILVAAPSNSAANLIAERLLLYKKSYSNSIVRLIAHHMIKSESIPDIIKPYCATINIAKEETTESTHVVRDGINLNVHASYIARYRVSIGTCNCIGTLAHLGLPKGHFTHVIVDEAGYALEPEIMIPLTFINKEHGQIILAGDPKQLGPVVLSKYCREFGFDVSYLSRILDTFPYQRDYNAFANGFNEKFVTRLTENYRSLEEVITLPSEIFYDSSLVAKLDRNMSWISRMLDVVSEIFEITENPKTGGNFVYGIKGCNERAADSPSWFNPQEASMIALTVCKLFKKNIALDEIGIITPYIAQIRYIRLLFDAMGLPKPKIGTVEEFQGQEKPLIIMSTVRTSEADILIDQKHALGFIKNPKRTNVALTRAQVAVLLFCDPHLLLHDPLWHKVIMHSVKSDKYMGCELPFNYVKKMTM